MGCDLAAASCADSCTILSVSSNGSNGLRHLLAETPEVRQQPFSILERIEWAATPQTAQAVVQLLHLSVSSNGSNGLRRTARTGISSLTRTFSILERIEWAATAAARTV